MAKNQFLSELQEFNNDKHSKVEELAVSLICEFEGFRDTVYCDVAGIPTIGYGRTKLSVAECSGLATTTEEKERRYVLSYIRDNITPEINKISEERFKDNRGHLSSIQRIALTSLLYNIGVGYNWQRSNTRGCIVHSNFNDKEAGEFIRKWNKAGGKVSKGLCLRRIKESLLFEADSINDYQKAIFTPVAKLLAEYYPQESFK